MTKEKMTAPVASVGADGEQPLNNKITNQSIADLPVKGNLQATNNAENVAKSANKKNLYGTDRVSHQQRTSLMGISGKTGNCPVSGTGR